ncbi:MAG TPA: T9SS type A sorting domain-containing protein [Dyadobacter sp.]|jgi:hypothetical protein|nr:T9SS type A sorting domain-containing protein [Dyadobacter sp.]
MTTPSSNSLHTRLLARSFVLLWLMLGTGLASYAQLRLVPYTAQSQVDQDKGDKSDARVLANVALPFFDDFSTAKRGTPDTTLWMKGSGVFVNNTMTHNHPSVNVATFDGLNAAGRPYNFTSPLAQNFTDTLTSKPIDLSAKAAKDSIYISFFWLGKGLGEMPDSSDFLRLEFLDRTGTWINAWQQQGFELDTVFTQTFVKVTNAAMFHSAFQFRFRSYGRTSGSYDMWHLDYVYLNANRTFRDRFTPDLTVRNPLTSLLNGFTAMPLSHYRKAASTYKTSSVAAEVLNRNNNFNIYTYNFSVRDDSTGAVYYQAPVSGTVNISASQVQRFSIPVGALTIPAANKKANLRYKFAMSTTDNQNAIGDLRRNDSISAVTHLDNFYAFDDGSAEYGIQITQRRGRAAVKYTMVSADTLGGVYLSLLPFDTDVSGQSFLIQIYNDKNGLPDQLLTQQAVAVRYTDNRNGFITCKFANPVAVPATFYVGWLQVDELPVSIGFDRNSSATERIYSNVGTEWAVENGLRGSIMLRPFLGAQGVGVPVGLEPSSKFTTHFFPNPGTGTINWKVSSLKKIDVYTVDGRLIKTIVPGSRDSSADIGVAEGMYILKSTDGKRTFAQKIIVVK